MNIPEWVEDEFKEADIEYDQQTGLLMSHATFLRCDPQKSQIVFDGSFTPKVLKAILWWYEKFNQKEIQAQLITKMKSDLEDYSDKLDTKEKELYLRLKEKYEPRTKNTS